MKNKTIAKLMGQVVLVDREYYREHQGNLATWKPTKLHKPRPGWIIGTRWLQRGYLVCCDRAYFEEDGLRTQCLLVVYWPTMRPVRVPLDGYRETDQAPYLSVVPWTDRAKKEASEDAKWLTRDALGRFDGGWIAKDGLNTIYGRRPKR